MDTLRCVAGAEVAPCDLSRLLDFLNKALAVEYGFIVDCARLAALIPDGRLKARVNYLGRSSLEHAQVAGALIRDLGGDATKLCMDLFPEGSSVHRVLEIQVEKEKLARWLYQRCGELLAEPELKTRMAEMAAAEEGHVRMVERLLNAVAAP